jgi:hypothetical protein
MRIKGKHGEGEPTRASTWSVHKWRPIPVALTKTDIKNKINDLGSKGRSLLQRWIENITEKVMFSLVGFLFVLFSFVSSTVL